MAESRTWVIGDVHGCANELADLLRACGVDDRDRVVFVGDLVGKGPFSDKVVQIARDLGADAVMGNHDVRCVQWWRNQQRGIKAEPEPAHAHACHSLTDEDWQWLSRRPFVLPLPREHAIVVHAGLVPGIPLDEQDPKHMSTMRSLRDDGSPSKRIEDGIPWASAWPGPELVIFGHDAVRGLQQYPHALGLDTGCVYGGALTACALPSRRLISVPAQRDWCPVRESA